MSCLSFTLYILVFVPLHIRAYVSSHAPIMTVRSNKNLRVTTIRFGNNKRLKTVEFADATANMPMMVWASNGTTLFKGVLDYTGSTLQDCDKIDSKEVVVQYEQNFDNELHEISAKDDLNSGDEAQSAVKDRHLLDNFDDIEQACMKFHGRIMSKVASKRRRSKRELSKWIWPGTKWCGHGDIASSDQDYGVREDMDKCCQAHDRCPYAITGFEHKYGYRNWQLHTLSHCDCDDSFFKCLSNATNVDPGAKYLGEFYFNFIQTSCFILEVKPVCAEYTWWGTCNKKELGVGATIRQTPTF